MVILMSLITSLFSRDVYGCHHSCSASARCGHFIFITVAEKQGCTCQSLPKGIAADWTECAPGAKFGPPGSYRDHCVESHDGNQNPDF